MEGTPLIDLPLTERHERLAELVDKRQRGIQISATFDDGPALYEAAQEQRFEGIMAKRADSPYEPGRRTRNWLKLKTQGRQELVIAGYTKGQGRRADAFGALVLGVYENGVLRWAGNVGTGFDDAEIARLLSRLKPLRRDDSPFAEVPKMPKVRKGDVVWVEPELVAEVRFAEWTHDGRLRAPVYQGLREDKEADEVHRERPSIEPEIKKGKRVLKLSNLDKPFWPDEGITKGDLLAYYRDVAPAILPHLQDRPFTMKRYPDGWNGKFFFQKDAPKHMPDWIPTRPFEASTRDKPPQRRVIDFPLVNDELALLWVVNMGCIDMNTWYSRVDKPVTAGLGAVRPRPVAGRRLPRDDPGRAADQGDARSARARVVSEDERLGGDPHPRPGRAAAHLRPDARVLGDHRRCDRAGSSRARDDRVDEGEATRRPDRLESERGGEDDRLGVFGAAEGRRARLDAAAVGRGERVARPGRLHDGRRARADRAEGDLFEGVLTTKQSLSEALRSLR